MDIIPEIKNRRSIRKYMDRELTEEQINLLIEAARLAPSGSNLQPWDFMVVKSQEIKEKIENQDINQSVLCIGLKAEYAKKE